MATRFLVSGGTTNWNNNGNWAATSGGASGATFPIFGDDVVLDGLSNSNLIINVTSQARSFSASPDYSFTVSGSGALSLSGGSVTFSTGMTLTTTGVLGFSGGTTITSNGKKWGGALQPQLPGIYTLNDDFGVASISHAVGGAATAINGNTLNVVGNITMSSGRSLSGTTAIRVIGSGTYSVTGLIRNNFQIATSGTSTFGATFTYRAGKLTYISGATDCITNDSTLFISDSTSLQTSGMTWNNVSFITTAGLTATLNSTLNVGGTLTNSIVSRFSGTSGFITNNFASTAANRTITLESGTNYTINQNCLITGTLANPILLNSSLTGGTKAFLTLSQGATQDISFGSATDIDSSLGQTIKSRKGTLTRATNWSLLTAPRMIGTSY